MSDAAYVVIGIGCQRGCPLTTLDALLDQVLQAHRIERRALKALASMSRNVTNPGCWHWPNSSGYP